MVTFHLIYFRVEIDTLISFLSMTHVILKQFNSKIII